ncbi:hypothetical protein N0V82_009503 [Gnomoniopsis sp. IMI 355080]|nr:hypothetical protein N0V82_009503 [Gnomoniopsis sp. IMI 355080]
MESVILGLRLFEESDQNSKQTILVPSTDVKFHATAAVLDLGLRMLESPAGQAGLNRIGSRLVHTLKNHEHIYDKSNKSPKNSIPEWTSLFLRRLRATFPNVILNQPHGRRGPASKVELGQSE